MTDVRIPVTLDAALWARVDAIAERSGRSRDQVIRDSLRRDLAGVALAAVLAKVRGRDELTGDEALRLVAEEKARARAKTQASSRTVAPSKPA